MTSFIIVGNNESAQEEKIQGILQPFGISQFDITIIKREVDEKTDKVKQSLGIGDVKKMQQKAFLKPFQSENKAIIIKEAELLTTEAQNALLKILEEPPAHTIIVLQTNNLESVLPTILSRCSIIQLDEQTTILEEEEKKQFLQTLNAINNWGIGESLNQAELLGKNKGEAIAWLEKMILVAREEMLKENNKQANSYAQVIRKLQTTHTTLSKTNANPRLQLESLFLSIQSI